MNHELLETLVKLAAAGTSGVCVLCVAATGFVTWKLPDSASTRKYRALKHYMISSLVIALISAVTTGLAGYWDFKTKQVLRQENLQLEKTTGRQAVELAQAEQELGSLQTVIEQSQAQLAALETQKEILVSDKLALESKLKTSQEEFAEIKAIVSALKERGSDEIRPASRP